MESPLFTAILKIVSSSLKEGRRKFLDAISKLQIDA